jgi:hypothetical protein
MIVWVYRNLRHGLSSRPLYSVMYKGRVIRHTHKILLRNAEFKVRDAGRKRILQGGCKNVHAFVIGTPVKSAFGVTRSGRDFPTRIHYNPRNDKHFMAISGPELAWPVKSALAVLLNERGVSAAYPVQSTED